MVFEGFTRDPFLEVEGTPEFDRDYEKYFYDRKNIVAAQQFRKWKGLIYDDQGAPNFIPIAALTPQPFIDSNNCLHRGVISIFMGGLMGFFIGPILSPSTVEMNKVDTTDAPLRIKIKEGAIALSKAGWRMARAFAVIGFYFSASDAALQMARGRKDLINSAIAGAYSGAMVSLRGGPAAVLFGSVTFSLFSIAFDWFLEGTDPRDIMNMDLEKVRQAGLDPRIDKLPPPPPTVEAMMKIRHSELKEELAAAKSLLEALRQEKEAYLASASQ